MEERNGNALIEIEIISGRTHQIRLHMASIGYPILNDPKYGLGGNGQRLVSYKIIFNFSSPSDILEYLNGKTIEITKDQLDKYLFEYKH